MRVKRSQQRMKKTRICKLIRIMQVLMLTRNRIKRIRENFPKRKKGRQRKLQRKMTRMKNSFAGILKMTLNIGHMLLSCIGMKM